MQRWGLVIDMAICAGKEQTFAGHVQCAVGRHPHAGKTRRTGGVLSGAKEVKNQQYANFD